jgi:hypothetical protein
VDRATAGRWRIKFEADRRVITLLPRRRGRPPGTSQIDPRVDELIDRQLRSHYLQRPSIRSLIERIHSDCDEANLPKPSWRAMSFAGQPREALEFVAHKHPLWSCPECAREFAGRDPVRITLRQWFVAVASSCRRCGGRLAPTRFYTARAIQEIIAASELYQRHIFVCDSLARAFDDERPIGAVTRAMRALAAPLPTDNQVLSTAPAIVAACPVAPARRHRFCGSLSEPGSFAATRRAIGIGDLPLTAHTQHGHWSAKSPRLSV